MFLYIITRLSLERENIFDIFVVRECPEMIWTMFEAQRLSAALFQTADNIENAGSTEEVLCRSKIGQLWDF